MYKPKQNKCSIIFKCDDDYNGKCYQFSDHLKIEEEQAKICTKSLISNGLECKSKIANVNSAFIYLKNEIGDKNTLNMLKDLIKSHESV